MQFTPQGSIMPMNLLNRTWNHTAGTDNEISLSKSARPLVRTIIHRVPIYPDSSKTLTNFGSEISLSYLTLQTRRARFIASADLSISRPSVYASFHRTIYSFVAIRLASRKQPITFVYGRGNSCSCPISSALVLSLRPPSVRIFQGDLSTPPYSEISQKEEA